MVRKIAGEDAAGYDAVRLDSFTTVNAGILLYADADGGTVKWKDATGGEYWSCRTHAVRL